MKSCIAKPALLVLAALLARGVAAAGPDCASVEVSALAKSVPSRTSTFRATSVLDLAFGVFVPASVKGEHTLELRVTTPDGHLYRSLTVPLAELSRASRDRSVPGYDRPIRETGVTRVLRGGKPFVTASVPFPVAGTDIVSSGLYGRWQVEARLDGAEQPCAPATSFVLQP